MQPKNKAERLWLIDIDSQKPAIASVISECIQIEGNGQVFSHMPTPNGHHLITGPFDVRIIEPWKDVAEVKKDALLFISKYEVKLWP